MEKKRKKVLESILTVENYNKLMAIESARLHQFVAYSIELCNPSSVFVCTDSPEDISFIRQQAIQLEEEIPLKTEGHTIHFDGYRDQGRDKAITKYLVPPGLDLGSKLSAIGKAEGLAEVLSYLKNSMVGRKMFVRFFSLGPINSEFSLLGVQLTDSAYVGHSEDLLYRPAYEQFKKLKNSDGFFRVLHSAGELKDAVSANPHKKRVYIDLEDETVYSVNTQYAGNTVGFKKLSLRLAIRKADREAWLAEHMFVMGVHGPENRVTYFTGAFPSFCGKTSTAMMAGETIIGDDLAYLRRKKGRIFAVNVESGVFGIIQNVNAKDDPGIWKAINSPGEVIFSNVLNADGVPYWLGDGRKHPDHGVNFAGEWSVGKIDEDGVEIPLAHKNARYTIRLTSLDNLDERANDPNGVLVGGIIYGGRDSDTWVPVLQSFDWAHGVITIAASLESESTAATIGEEGVRSFNPMSNLDFLSIPLGRYIENHLNFVKGLKNPPLIFGVNYFLKAGHGDYLNKMVDKRVWIKWMELRVHEEADAVRTPTGYIPLYKDLKRLFKKVLDSDYTKEQYIEQFSVRIPENLRKIARIENIYKTQVPDTPWILFAILDEQRKRLIEAQKKYGDYISPRLFEME